jgi:signal transduction histidine kinase
VQLAHPELTLELTLQGDLRGNFDRDRVHQAVGNLLTNAVQHGRAPISIAAWESEDRRSLITRVSSAGEPIPPEKVAKLFEAFSHAADTNKPGLGLGLFIVAQIARAHGGTCEVTSSEGSTAFSIRWPRTPLSEVPGRTGDKHP